MLARRGDTDDYLIWNYIKIKTFHHLEDNMTSDISSGQGTQFQLGPLSNWTQSTNIGLAGDKWQTNDMQKNG